MGRRGCLHFLVVKNILGSTCVQLIGEFKLLGFNNLLVSTFVGGSILEHKILLGDQHFWGQHFGVIQILDLNL